MKLSLEKCDRINRPAMAANAQQFKGKKGLLQKVSTNRINTNVKGSFGFVNNSSITVQRNELGKQILVPQKNTLPQIKTLSTVAQFTDVQIKAKQNKPQIMAKNEKKALTREQKLAQKYSLLKKGIKLIEGKITYDKALQVKQKVHSVNAPKKDKLRISSQNSRTKDSKPVAEAEQLSQFGFLEGNRSADERIYSGQDREEVLDNQVDLPKNQFEEPQLNIQAEEFKEETRLTLSVGSDTPKYLVKYKEQDFQPDSKLLKKKLLRQIRRRRSRKEHKKQNRISATMSIQVDSVNSTSHHSSSNDLDLLNNSFVGQGNSNRTESTHLQPFEQSDAVTSAFKKAAQGTLIQDNGSSRRIISDCPQQYIDEFSFCSNQNKQKEQVHQSACEINQELLSFSVNGEVKVEQGVQKSASSSEEDTSDAAYIRRHTMQEQIEFEHFQMLVKPVSRNKKNEAESKEVADKEIEAPFFVMNQKDTKILGKRRRAIDEVGPKGGLLVTPQTEANSPLTKENKRFYNGLNKNNQISSKLDLGLVKC